MMKAYRALERLAIRSIESEGIGLSDFGVMEMLLHKGAQPVNEIGRRIGLTSGAITPTCSGDANLARESSSKSSTGGSARMTS